MFLAGFFITMSYSVSYLAFTITAKELLWLWVIANMRMWQRVKGG